jgi:prevent-host-death family protein
MGTITAKQLKQKTGEVIKRIKSGERLTLTYRGKPLAVIEPTTDKDINKLNFVSTMVTWDNEHFKDKFAGKVLTPDEFIAGLA